MVCPPPQVILGLVHAENRWGILPVVKFELIDLYDTSPAVHISESIDSVALHPQRVYDTLVQRVARLPCLTSTNQFRVYDTLVPRGTSVSPDSLALQTTFMRNEEEILGPFPFSRLVYAPHPTTKGGHKRVSGRCYSRSASWRNSKILNSVT